MVLFPLIFALCFLHVSSSEGCPELLRRYSKSHSFCQPANQTCNIQVKGADRDSIDVILRKHNLLRSEIASGNVQNLPSASYMMQMVWDDELAGVAQKHAEQCTFAHDCSSCRRVQNFGVGQNLAMQIVTVNPPDSKYIPPANWASAIQSWYDEIKYFNKDFIEPFAVDSSYGHFSQVLWADTWRIGCGYVVYRDEERYKQLYVCNYGSNGNIKDGYLYKIGHPCSKCPVNSSCYNGTYGTSPVFSGLCKLDNINEEPIFNQPKDSKILFFCDFHNQPDCKFSVTENNYWRTYNTLSGNYVGIILDGGKTSTVVFEEKIKPKSETFCFVIKYRKGAHLDEDEDANTAIEIFNIISQNSQQKIEQELMTFDLDYKHQFNQFSMTLSWNMTTEFQLKFSVPPGKAKQFLEIQSIYATDGKCQ